MGMFDSFLLNHQNDVIEQQTKDFECILDTISLGHKTILDGIKNKTTDKDNIKIITISKGHNDVEDYYYNIVFIHDLMVDYSITQKSFIETNKQKLLNIWTDPNLKRLGLTKALHISGLNFNSIDYIEKQNQYYLSQDYLNIKNNNQNNNKKRIDLNQKLNNDQFNIEQQFLFEEQILDCPKTKTFKLNKYLNVLKDESGCQISVVFAGTYFEKLKNLKFKKLIDMDQYDLINDFLIHSFGHNKTYINKLKLLMPSFLFMPEKTKLIKLIYLLEQDLNQNSENKLDFTIENRHWEEYLIAQQKPNHEPIQEIINYNSGQMNGLIKLETLNYKQSKDSLYNQLSHINNYYNGQHIIFYELKEENKSYYRIYYLLNNDSNIGLWSSDSQNNKIVLDYLTNKCFFSYYIEEVENTMIEMNNQYQSIYPGYIKEIVNKNPVECLILFFLMQKLDYGILLNEYKKEKLKNYQFISRTRYNNQTKKLETIKEKIKTRATVFDYFINLNNNQWLKQNWKSNTKESNKKKNNIL